MNISVKTKRKINSCNIPCHENSGHLKLKVAVRVRPVSQKELNKKHELVVKVIEDKYLTLKHKTRRKYERNRRLTSDVNDKGMLFIFDNVFSTTATNTEIFDVVIKDLVGALLDGFNCSVFFYGASGTGKTYTMFGRPENPGIVYLTIQELFDNVNLLKSERDFQINVSYLEIYNENIYDLLRSSKSLKMFEDNNSGLVISGLHYPKINTAKELRDLINKGNINRSQYPTSANEMSSRSHAVCQIYVRMKNFNVNRENLAKLSLTDLAGCERVSSTRCTGLRFHEAKLINKSVLALGNCLNSLANGSKYVPYRGSKLTRILKDSLGGNSRTVMVANIAPTDLTYDTTLNSLRYATQAKKIELHVNINSFHTTPPSDQGLITSRLPGNSSLVFHCVPYNDLPKKKVTSKERSKRKCQSLKRIDSRLTILKQADIEQIVSNTNIFSQDFTNIMKDGSFVRDDERLKIVSMPYDVPCCCQNDIKQYPFEQRESVEELLNKWKNIIEVTTMPCHLIFKELLKCEYLQKELTMYTLQRNQMAAYLKFLFVKCNDTFIKSYVKIGVQNLNNDVHIFSQKSSKMKNDIEELKRRSQICDAELKTLFDDVLVAHPIVESLVDHVKLKRALIIAEIREKHLEAVIKMHVDEMQEFQNFVTDIFVIH